MKKDYISKYNKENYKQYIFRVRKDDELIINQMDRIGNRNSYLRYLVESDISEERKTYTLAEIKKIVKPILNSYDIKDIYLFGSYARGEANKDSDVDIYCEKGIARSFIKQAALIDELEKALKKHVDIIFNTATLQDGFRKNMEDDLIKLC